MELGAESRKKTIIAISLMVLSLIFVAVRFLPDSPAAAKSPTPAVTPEPTARRNAGRRSGPGRKAPTASTESSLDPTLRYDWLKASEDTKYAGAGRNIFRAQDPVIPKPVAKVQTPAPVIPQGPPPPPPINLKFFGFANKPGEAKKIFLSQGEDVFIAGEGDIVDRRYKILHITPVSVEVEDVLNNNRQSIPLTQG
jgi:hypothetical protein